MACKTRKILFIFFLRPDCMNPGYIVEITEEIIIFY